MNKDKDAKITYSEFVECSKQDPTVMDVRPVPRSHTGPCSHAIAGTLALRRSCIVGGLYSTPLCFYRAPRVIPPYCSEIYLTSALRTLGACAVSSLHFVLAFALL